MASSSGHEWVTVIFPADEFQPAGGECFCKKCGMSANDDGCSHMTCEEFAEIVASHANTKNVWSGDGTRLMVDGKPGWLSKRTCICDDCGLLMRVDVLQNEQLKIECVETFSDYGYKEVLRHCRELRMRKALT